MAVVNFASELWDTATILKNSNGLFGASQELSGLATHYVEFDRMTSGLQNSELIIIASNRSMGKTAWAINIAGNVAVRDGKTVAFLHWR